MINPEAEKLITLRQVCGMFPGRQGKGMSLSSVWRWVLHGRKGHKLESIRIGGQRYTSKEAVSRYIAAINEDQDCLCRESVDRKLRDERVDHQLDAEGFS